MFGRIDKHALLILCVFGLLLLFKSPAAHAALIPVHTEITQEGDFFRWHYTLRFTASVLNAQARERLDAVPPLGRPTGNFVTLYDLSGYLPGSATAPQGFSVSESLLGPHGYLTLPDDDPQVLNVTWTYTGPPLLEDTLFVGASILSIHGADTLGFFTAETTRNTAPVDTPIGQIGFVLTPIPEPASLAVLAAATGLLLVRRRSIRG